MSSNNLRKKFICERHFEDNDFCITKKCYLKTKTVPKKYTHSESLISEEIKVLTRTKKSTSYIINIINSLRKTKF